ncbi:MAG TPA: alpha/beta hydrolase, partial [Pseudolysinimonas sp.]|nr:alpha/beta hydrolase [Pseudolysinimonas sp.]
IVQIVHGVGEYATRYEDLAQALVAANYTVYASDLRGHGQTGLQQWNHDTSKLGRLGPGGVRATIAGIRQLSGIAHAEHTKLPLVLLGHSLGSIFGQMMLNDDASPYSAAVLSATPYRTLWHMNGGDLSKRHRVPGGTGTEWLSRDPDVWTRFAADPLTFDAKVAKLFGVTEALRLLGRPTKLNRDLPVLILIGSEDPLGGPRSVELLANAYRTRGGLSDVEVKIYEGGRHEMFNEINREEVIADVVAWLDTKLSVTARS